MQFLLNFIDNSINRQFDYVQVFNEVRQLNNQSVKKFDTYLINLKVHLTPYIEKQQMIHLFTKLRLSLRDVVTNYQNVSKIKTKLLMMIIRMKSNMRREHKTLQLQKNKKSKNFHDRKRKKNDKNKKNERSSSRRRRDDRKKNSFKSNAKKSNHSKLICFICDKKKHIFSNCFDKNKKKTSVNTIKNDKIKKKKALQTFRQSKKTKTKNDS